MQAQKVATARNVSFQLKDGKRDELNTLFTRDVLPLLQRQEGFREEMMLIDDSGHHAIGISLWDTPQSAENYRKSAYAQVLETLRPVIEGSPTVETFQIAATTLN